MFTVLLVIHVVGAIFLVGPLAVLPMIGLREVRRSHADGVAALARSTRLFSLLSLIVVIVGFGVLALSPDREPPKVTTPWVAASIIIYLAAISLSLFVTVPSLTQEAARLAAPAPADAEPGRIYRRVAASSGATSLGLVVIAVLMVWQP